MYDLLNESSLTGEQLWARLFAEGDAAIDSAACFTTKRMGSGQPANVHMGNRLASGTAS